MKSYLDSTTSVGVSGLSDIKPWENCPPNGPMLRPAQVFDRTNLSKSQVYALIADGKFPPFIKLSARASAMPEAWLEAFIIEKARDAIEAGKR